MMIEVDISTNKSAPRFVCFAGSHRIAEGSLSDVALAAWRIERGKAVQPILTFNRETGAVVDLNLSGTENDVANRYIAVGEAPPKRGRPKLGVIPREITLLPRHWEWLARQPGGASATLRRLIDTARKDRATQDAAREHVAAAYSFMATIAGDLPMFEEASRELFAHNFSRLEALITKWPADIRNELMLFLHKDSEQP